MIKSPLWTPTQAHLTESRIAQIIHFINARKATHLQNYDDLYRWSINNIPEFWDMIWIFCAIKGDKGNRLLIDKNKMPGAQFFPDARLNYAENLLRKNDDADALVLWGEDRVKDRLSWKQLHEKVSQFTQVLTDAGIGEGDRVVACMPNLPETVIGMLATASLGAIWSSCSPDYGEQGILDRFEQIEPGIMLACDGYFYNGKQIDILPKLKRIVAKLPCLEKVIIVPCLRRVLQEDIVLDDICNACLFDELMDRYRPGPVEFKRLPFSHPLFILFSSGTTGVPKCIVHSAGGTLLQHMKEHQLHTDIKPGDRFFYFTTCAWMMWNWLVSGLASEATLLLYDGSPFYPDGNILWDYADAEGMTQFGTSAKYIEALNKHGLRPQDTHELKALRLIASTGSPLAAESYDYVYEHIKPTVYLGSIAGGTDIISCFVSGNPIQPVYRGEIPCRGLGMAVEIWNEDGQAVYQQKGELVCTKPFPSMPLYFWGDNNNEKYRAAYFEKYPGAWVQGDFAEITGTGGVIIYGRSDATLNPGGVRIGTAEIYRQVDMIDEVVQSVVIGQTWGNDVRIVLFVVLKDGVELDENLSKRIKTRIRTGSSPRHVPAKVIQVTDIPLTKSGKISELPVKAIVEGREVKNREALANPEALDNFRDLPDLME